ncbi:MAG: hypothetical protein AAGI90_00035 [Chlamydiota bacterium]
MQLSSFLAFCLLFSATLGSIQGRAVNQAISQDLILDTKQVMIEEYSGAYNPSILPIENGFLLSFRYLPDFEKNPYFCYIGVVELDQNFHPTSSPQLINTRTPKQQVQSQAEDARLFSYQDKIYLIYNDNTKIVHPTDEHRRDMFLAELKKNDDGYFVDSSIKLISREHYETQKWQKNWSPFVWQEQLFISYTLDPHEVLQIDLETGECVPCFWTPTEMFWDYGRIRGSSIPCLMGDEYFAFFHSGRVMISDASSGELLWHYFAGAYTFSDQPPFEITRVSKYPILGDKLYTNSGTEKRVIFPGGFVVDDDCVYLSYGKDDGEIWIATLSLEVLLHSLVKVHPSHQDIKDFSKGRDFFKTGG